MLGQRVSVLCSISILRKLLLERSYFCYQFVLNSFVPSVVDVERRWSCLYTQSQPLQYTFISLHRGFFYFLISRSTRRKRRTRRASEYDTTKFYRQSCVTFLWNYRMPFLTCVKSSPSKREPESVATSKLNGFSADFYHIIEYRERASPTVILP
jgi:hypothetical protein